MTMEQPGHDESKPASAPMRQPAAAVVPNPSRRRFNRAGVGASAVVLTLASRSVLADTLCKSPSGFDSIAPSMHANDQPNLCQGVGPSQWLARTDWPVPKDTLFLANFGTASLTQYAISPVPETNPNGVLLKDATLEQALKGTATPLVVKNLIAAWLNALRGYNSFPTADQVIHIYQEWQKNTYYEVRATIKWYEPEINKYLASVRSTDQL